jgi:hypothetical protein
MEARHLTDGHLGEPVNGMDTARPRYEKVEEAQSLWKLLMLRRCDYASN